MTDEQQAPVGSEPRQRVAGLARVEAARQRRMGPQALTLLPAPLCRRELGRLARTHLGAEQHRLEARFQARDGGARGSRLTLAARGQRALGIRTCTVGLGLGVT